MRSMRTSDPSLFERAGVAQRCRAVRGDVRDLDLLVRENDRLPAGRTSCTWPRRPWCASRTTIRSTPSPRNVIGTVNVSRGGARCPSVAAIVNVTSDK